MAAGYPPRFCWPIVVDATCDTIGFDEGGAPLLADVADGTYFWRGDGTAADMCLALKTALDAAGALTYTVTIATTGVLTIAATGPFTLLWLTGGGDLPAATCGFANADQGSVANACVGDFQVAFGWWPEQMAIVDSERFPAYRSVQSTIMNGRTRTQLWGARMQRRVLVDVLPARKIFTAEEVRLQEAFERFYAYLATGGRFELTINTAVPGTYQQYVPLGTEFCSAWPAQIPDERVMRRYDVMIPMQAYVA